MIKVSCVSQRFSPYTLANATLIQIPGKRNALCSGILPLWSTCISMSTHSCAGSVSWTFLWFVPVEGHRGLIRSIDLYPDVIQFTEARCTYTVLSRLEKRGLKGADACGLGPGFLVLFFFSSPTFNGGYYNSLSFAAPKPGCVETICQASSGRGNDIPWEQTGTGTDGAHLRMK